MSNTDGEIRLGMVVDTSEAQNGLDKGLQSVDDFVDKAVARTSEITESLNNIPDINLHVNTDVTDVQTAINAQEMLDEVIHKNQTSIDELEAEYQRVGKSVEQVAAKDAQSQQKAVDAAKKQQAAIKQVIDARKQVITQAKQEEAALKKVVSTMSANDRASVALAGGMRTTKGVMREMQSEMVALEAAGKRNTQAFAELQAATARMSDAMSDAKQQTSILANDQAGFQGVISGISGMTGAFAAAQGAMSLFGEQNEDLQRIMVRLQSLMAITMGLQQVSVMLNKDSAFSLVTLNAIKSLFSKNTKKSAEALKEENAAVEDNTKTTDENTTSQELNATTKEAESVAGDLETASEEANTGAKAANTTATQESVVAGGADVVTKNAQTGATTAMTIATKAASVAMKGLKAAIVTTGIGALIVLVGELVNGLMSLFSSTSKAEEEQKKLNECHEKGAEAYSQAKTQLNGYVDTIKNFSGNAEQKQRLLDEINGKYGEQLGYAESLDEAERLLTERGEAYCQMLQYQAEAQALLNEASAAYVEILRVTDRAQRGEYDDHGYEFWNWGGKSSQDKRDEAIKNAEDYYNMVVAKYEEVNKKARDIQTQFDFGSFTDPKKKTISGKSNKNTFDPKKAAEQERKLWEDYEKYRGQIIKQITDTQSAANLSYMTEGLNKDLATSKANFAKLEADWKEQFLNLALALKKARYDAFMLQEDASMEKWLESAEGKMTDQQWLDKMFSDDQKQVDTKRAEGNTEVISMQEQYQAYLTQLEEQGTLERIAITQRYTDEMINKYGDMEQRRELLTRQYMQALNNDQWNFGGQFSEQIMDYFEKAFADLDMEEMKKSFNWESVFGNLEAVGTSALQKLKTQLQSLVKSQKDLSPEAIKTYVDAIQNIDEQLRSRNPFTQLKSDYANLRVTTKALTEAQIEYNKALKEGTPAEQAAAAATLDAAKAAKQKALAELTQSLQSSANKAKEIVDATSAVTGMLETMGVDIPEELSGFIGGMGDAIDGLASINLSNPMSIVTGGAKAISGIVSGISSLFNHDAAKEKKIQKLQDQIDALQKSYDKLGKSVDDVYSKDAAALLEQQNSLLQQQKILIQNQISAEKSKKNSDSSRIKEWQEQLDEINDLIEENKQKAIDAIFGEDISTAIENFADAWADAWADGSDRAESAKDTVKKMMKQMVKESIKAAIQSSAAMEKIRAKLQEFYADNVLSDWEQDYILKMAEELQEELDKQFGWAQSLLEGDAEREGASRGIATASQESVDENNARLTTIQGHTYTLVQGMVELNRTSNAILDKVAGIERHTAESAETLDEMNKSLKLVKASVDDIQTKGIRLKA